MKDHICPKCKKQLKAIRIKVNGYYSSKYNHFLNQNEGLQESKWVCSYCNFYMKESLTL